MTSSSTTSIDNFLPIINRECPGLPVFTARAEILRACREFCRTSLLWRETLDSIPAISNIAEYDLNPPTNTEIVLILSMRQGDGTNNRIIQPKTEEELDRKMGFWRDKTSSQAYCFVHEKDASTFLLVPYPDSTIVNSISDIRVALKPSMSATQVCSTLYSDYEEEIGRGALAKLQKLPKKPWSNRARAAEHERFFDYSIAQARIRARKSFSRSDVYANSKSRFGAV